MYEETKREKRKDLKVLFWLSIIEILGASVAAVDYIVRAGFDLNNRYLIMMIVAWLVFSSIWVLLFIYYLREYLRW